MEKTKKEFEWTEKETYTHAELKTIMGDLKGYYKVDALFEENANLSTQVETLTGELSPFRTEKFGKTVKGQLPKNFKQSAYDDFLKVSGITEEDDEEAIKTKTKDTLKGRDYFLSKETENMPPEKGGNIVETQEKKTELQKVINDKL